MLRLYYLPAFLLVALPWLNPFAPGPSPSVVPWLFTLACGAVLMGVAVVGSRKRRHADKNLVQPYLPNVAMAWLAAGLLSSAFGLLQYFGAAEPLNPWINQTQLGEAFANLRQRNQFATLTNIGLAALVWVVFHNQQLVITTQAKRAAVVCVTLAGCLLAVGNAISSSRTGLFQLLLLCGLWLTWGGWRLPWLRRLLFGVLAVYFVAMFAAPIAAGLDLSTHGALARMDNDTPCSSRWVLWSNVLELIGQKPWLGWGWGQLDYAHFMVLYDKPRFCGILDNAHNLPLHLAVELGLPFAVLVCGAFILWVVRQKPWHERQPDRQLAWSVMAIILLHSMLEYPLWYGPFLMAFGLCVLILRRGSTRPKNTDNYLKKESNRPVAPVKQSHIAIFSIAVFVLIMTAGVAWDYRRVSQIYLAPELRAAAYQDDTLAKASQSWLFADQARFAELMLTPLTRGNAQHVHGLAEQLLAYSPEPRVIEKLIESAVMLGLDDEARAYLARYRAAFPAEHAVWVKANLATPTVAKRL